MMVLPSTSKGANGYAKSNGVLSGRINKNLKIPALNKSKKKLESTPHWAPVSLERDTVGKVFCERLLGGRYDMGRRVPRAPRKLKVQKRGGQEEMNPEEDIT